jgi:hypothetical protein
MPDDTPRPDVLARARELRDRRYTYAAIAEALQQEKYPTASGAAWSPTVVWGILKAPHPRSASLAPCTECGRLTASKYQICPRRPACRPAYIQASNRAAAERLRELRGPTEPSKPCASCGQPTTSALDVCARPSCWNAYARARTVAQGGGSFVYGVWFPSSCILKVGWSTRLTNARIGSSARGRAKRYNLDAGDGQCIWKRPGDTRTEAWIQSTLAFRWLTPFKATDGRLSEWFSVPAILTVDEITEVLDSTYRLVPPDLTRPAFELQAAGSL